MSPDSPAHALDDLEPDSHFGPYRISRLLGKGGMGAVYEAEHRDDGRVVALKLLSVDLDKMDSRERFLREGQAAAAINHPNAVYIYGTEEIDGTPAITMELVPGGTLDEKVKSRGPLPYAEAVEDILQVIDGLDAALEAGVLHRDVKPSNCFVDATGVVKIGDFGLSKPVEGEDQQKLTKTGLFLGTPVFSSPEQLLGETLDVRSDIYAVGVTFYFLLTGQLPYTSGSMMQVVAAVLNGSPAPITKYRSDLPQAVVDVAMKAIARKADDRFQSYAEFRAAVVALRVAEVQPTTIWDRMRSGFVDYMVNVALTWVISWMLLRPVSSAFASNSTFASDVSKVLISFILFAIVVAVPEGIRGFSIGKWLVGQRVIGRDGLPPGVLRSLLRTVVYEVPGFATLAVKMLMHEGNAQANVVLLTTIGLHLVLIVTARRANGWRLLQDMLTGTRVVSPQAARKQRRGEAQRATAPALAGNERRIGSYVVLGPASEGGTILRGWDGAMRRAVWIVPREINDPEVSAARRSVSRLTRLRWVGGRRAPNDSWDAYEAPLGSPLSVRLQQPVPWNVEQDWLLDIATELIATKSDGTLPHGLTADALWVTPADHIVFPEIAREGSHSHSTMLLIDDLVDRVHDANRGFTPLPGYAARTVEAARRATSPEDVLSLVRGAIGKPMTVSLARRAGLIAATVAPIVAITFAGWFTARQTSTMDDAGTLMSSLLSFVGDSSIVTADTVAARLARDEASTERGTRINAALRRLGFIAQLPVDTATPLDMLRRQRRLAEAYLVTSLGERTRDTSGGPKAGITPREMRRRREILARNTHIDSATAREARLLVDSVWKKQVPGLGPSLFVNYIPLVIFVFFVVAGAIIAMVCALAVRRGPFIRGFQLDIVNARGEPANRARLAVRTIACWWIMIVPLALWAVATSVSIATFAVLITASAVIVAVGWIAGIVWTIMRPSRGPAEIVSGTYLVPD